MYLQKQYIKYILLQNKNCFIEIIHLPMKLSLYEHEYSYKYKYEHNNLIQIKNKFIMVDNGI